MNINEQRGTYVTARREMAIIDALAHGARSAEQIAEATGIFLPLVQLRLSALHSAGTLTRHGERKAYRYGIAPLSDEFTPEEESTCLAA